MEDARTDQERLRTGVACDACRRRKSKCDMKKPSCQICISHNWTCAYSLRRKRPGPRKGSKSPLVTDVHRRLGRIEELLDSEQRSRTGPPLPTIEQPRKDPDERERRGALPRGLRVLVEPSTAATACSLAPADMQPFLEAIKWTQSASSLYLEKEASPQRPSVPSLSSAPDLSLSSDLESHLISLYFSHVTTPIPLFCKAKFYHDYGMGRVPQFLLDIIYALSIRFSTLPGLLQLASGNLVLLSQRFVARAVAEMDRISLESSVVTVTEVKATYLLSFFHYTCLGLREASELSAKATQRAYMCRLHQVDNMISKPADRVPTLELDAEENRCVWWAVYTLDSFSSLLPLLPSSIEDTSIATCLPATVLTELTTTNLPPMPLGMLEDELDQTLQRLQGLEVADTGLPGAVLQVAMIFATSMAREAQCLRRLSQENEHYNLQPRLQLLKQKWDAMFTALPVEFFERSRQALDRTTADHHQRLEVLSIVCIAGAMASAPPLAANLNWPTEPQQDCSTSEGAWKLCIAHAQKIVKLHREWLPPYFEKANPILFSISWTAGALLTLEIMNASLVDPQQKLDLLDALDFIMDYLQKFSRYWGLAMTLLRSLAQLRGHTWVKLDLRTILSLSQRVWAPLMQDIPGVGSSIAGMLPEVPENAIISDLVDESMAWDPTRDWDPIADFAGDDLTYAMNWLDSGPDLSS